MKRSATLRESVLTIAIGAFATVLAIYFQIVMTVVEWVRQHGAWAIYELVTVVVIAVCALSVFFLRQYGRELRERKALQSQLAHQSLHDTLTNLPNRVLFTDRAEHALARAKRRQETVAILFIDLDDFKALNESLGHEAGDSLLVEVGRRLSACVRSEDTVARFGGDEFAVLIESSPNQEGAIQVAARLAERVSEALAISVLLSSKEVFLRTSIGISTYAGERAEHLLRNAEVAMYAAKAKGKGRYEFYESAIHEAFLERMDLQADLGRAINNREFVVHYQPIVALGEAGSEPEVREFEALVRWRHPEKGMIPPGKFISLAEETGDIVRIGLLVLEEACGQVQQWRDSAPGRGHLLLSVNLSVRQFRHQDLADQILAVLRDTGLPPSSLKLEVTESAAMEDVDSAVSTLRRLRDAGIKVAIDDFGTGYSSLAYLSRLPVDTLKVDRSFVSQMEASTDSMSIVLTTVTLARALGLSVTAEGVENAGQLARLSEIGCDLAQGYHFARPMPPEEILFMLGETLPLEHGSIAARGGRIL